MLNLKTISYLHICYCLKMTVFFVFLYHSGSNISQAISFQFRGCVHAPPPTSLVDRCRAILIKTTRIFLNTLCLEPQAVAVSPYGWLMTHYGWLAGLSRLTVVSTAAA